MEARKITIISTRNNKRTVINTDATTLGDLKRALRDAGVDYDGMTFYEGLTKTELKMDSSILPHDVQRINPATHEPETTNELAFMLTNTNKKIRSGSVAMTRADAYSAIKEKGLQAECLKRFGKNFTMCKTADLISLVESSTVVKPTTSKPKAETIEAKAKVEAVATPASLDTPVDVQARAAVKKLANDLNHYGVLSDEAVEEIVGMLGGNNIPVSVQTGDYKPSSASPYSDDELDAMFKDIPM